VGNLKTFFAGELTKTSIDGKRLRITAISGGMFFDRKVPRFYLQAGCNHAVFSPGCGLVAADWKHEATITNPGTEGYPYEFVIGGLTRPAGGAVVGAVNAYAGGWAEIGYPGGLQLRAILASTAMSAGGEITLKFSSDPSPYPVAGLPITIYPGCDGRSVTCKSFGNFGNFGGHPFVPRGNPSLFKLSSDVGGGGKKG
jgi:hypothetical protein